MTFKLNLSSWGSNSKKMLISSNLRQRESLTLKKGERGSRADPGPEG